MKMYVFRPIEYGPMTYFVMSDTEENAVIAVKAHCEQDGIKCHTEWGGIDSIQKDGESQYTIEIHELNCVAGNNNS